MNKVPELSLALIAGAALGGFYFHSLWLVVRCLQRMRHPVFWLITSFIARTAITLAGFFVVMGGRWERIAMSLVGFLLARVAILTWRRPASVALRVE